MPDVLRLPPFFDGLILRYRERTGRKLKALCGAVEQLYRMFTGQQPLKPNYMSDEFLRTGYTYYYTPPNSLKVRWVLDELARFDPAFFSRPAVTLLDYGCGTGAGILGALQTARPFAMTAYDRNRDAYADTRFLFEAYREQTNNPCTLEFERTVPPERQFDLVVAMNVLNEMDGEGMLFKLLRHNVAASGYLIVIEPASRGMAHHLQRFRDKVAARGFKVAAPCLTSAPCPMLATLPTMWCCMSLEWDRPRFIAEVDARLGFAKTRLKFSYAVLTREGKTLGEFAGDGTARLVGDLHKEKGKHWGMFCGRAGTLRRCELLSRHNSENNLALRRAARGEIFQFEREEHADFDRFLPDRPVRKI